MENSWLLEMVQWKEQKEMRRKNNKVCAAALTMIIGIMAVLPGCGPTVRAENGSASDAAQEVNTAQEGNGAQEVPPVEDDAGEKIPSSDGDTSALDGEAANPDVVTGDTSPAQAGADSPAQDGGSGRTDSAAEGSALSD